MEKKMTTPTEQIDAIWDKWAYKPQFFMMKGHVQEEENSLEKRKQQFRQDILSVCKTMMREEVEEIVKNYTTYMNGKGDKISFQVAEVVSEILERIEGVGR